MNNNKNALVTGSTSGIGLAVAKGLLEQGYTVVIHGIESSIDQCGDLSSTLALISDNWIYIGADLSTREGMTSLTDQLDQKEIHIDILVNNAGFQHTQSFDQFDDDVWDQMLAVNLSAPFRLTKYALAHMKRSGYGRVINIASVHGLVASEKKAGYCATKHGLVGLTKVSALETADEDITVNAICPGWIETPLVTPQVDLLAQDQAISYDDAKRKLLKEKQPKAKMTPPSAVAAMVVFLISEAASTITGASLPIDGGWTAQ